MAKQTTETAPLLIAVREAASLIGFSKRWLEMRIREGGVPVVRTGKSVRMRRADVEAFARTGKWPKSNPKETP